MVPVIAPIGVGEDGHTYNINADTMAGAVAAALRASRLFLLTDVAGVLDKNGALLTDLAPKAIKALADDGTISGGMIPKLDRKSTRLNSSHDQNSYAVFCLKKKKHKTPVHLVR